MKTYSLHIETARRTDKTMVHVAGLTGCTAQGETLEQALDATPAAIRDFLRFLTRHGDNRNARARFRAIVAEHIVSSGRFVGRGSSLLHYRPDLKTISRKEIMTLTQRLEWTRSDVLKLCIGLSSKKINAKPRDGGRSVLEILEHIVEAERFYVNSTLGRVNAARRRSKHGDHIFPWMNAARQEVIERIRSLTPAQRARKVHTRTGRWTVRKMLRKMLEHEWEHLVKLERRLSLRMERAAPTWETAPARNP